MVCLQSKFNELCAQIGEGGFFLGNRLSYADLALYNALTATSAVDAEGYIGKHFPHVKRHFDAVEAHPAVHAYIKSSKRRPPFTPWTF